MTDGQPVSRRTRFHDLTVATVDPLTEDSLAITFAVPPELRPEFAFQAGQHLTLRRVEDGQEVRRSYSICSTPAELAGHGRIRVGVKRIPGGVFSAFAATGLRPGQPVQVLPPLGHFTTALDPARSRHYAAIVAGSGITPVLSVVATALAVEPHSRCTALYGNRDTRSVMFAEELADLKDRYPDRLHLVHVLSREPRDAELLSGRLDTPRLTALLDRVVDASTVDEWFLCGPYGLVLAAREVLASRGVPPGVVHTELFHPPDAAPLAAAPSTQDSARAPGATSVTVVLDGRSTSFEMGRAERVLDAALRVRPELPFSCRGGVCSTCRARVVTGEVTMAHNYALEPDELAAGYVLTCQSTPATDHLVIDYDA